MKYSLAFVAFFIGSFALQCAARPQPQVDLPAVPAAGDAPPASPVGEEPVLTDIGTGAATEASVSGDQVVFDETQANQGDAESAGVTTDMPSDDESQDDVTTLSPCNGEDCPAASALNIEEVVPTSEGGDAPAIPSGDDAEVTTQVPSSE